MKKFTMIFLLFFITCENVKNYEKIEELRNIYILINLTDKKKLKEICVESENIALSCIGTINTISYIILLNTFYQININTASPDPLDYCEQIIDSPTMIQGNLSFDAQRCHFQCNQIYWQSINNCNDYTSNINSYSKCLPGIWINNCENQVLKNCLRNCFLYGDPIFFIPNP